MNAGLPGTGIGGLFYLLSALWMPIREMGLMLSKRSPSKRWRLILLQFTIAVGILGGIWLTGWLLGSLLISYQTHASDQVSSSGSISGQVPNMIKVTFFFLTLGLLTVVIGSVHILKLFVHHRKRRRTFSRSVSLVIELHYRSWPRNYVELPQSRQRKNIVPTRLERLWNTFL